MTDDSKALTLTGPEQSEALAREQLPIATDLIAQMAGGRTWACAGACGAVIGWPGVCKGCDRKVLAEAHAARMRTARRTIPERFRWASFEAPELAQRTNAHALAEVRSLFGKRFPLGVVLVGQSGAGKTSLACALLKRIHDHVTFESGSALVERARRSWYVGAPELLQAVKVWGGAFSRGEPPEVLKMARAASILVLDNVDAGKQGDALYDLVFERHDRDRPTIVTTWMTRAEASAAYGDGWARRVYERTIDVSQPVRRLGVA